MKRIKILNAYAGIGGNRKLWGDGYDVTAVEIDPRIAGIYSHFFPNDKMVISDAHEYILEHHHEFDIVWCSPPCPTHSITNYVLNSKGIRRYPLMTLYQEIIYLSTFHKGLYIVENVKPYYKPLIEPQTSGRHCFWANFQIPALPISIRMQDINGTNGTKALSEAIEKLDFNIPKHLAKGLVTNKLLRNCVCPSVGLAIIKAAIDNLLV